MVVASVGVSGAILANIVSTAYDWRNAFYIGGALGLVLLIARISVAESGMFRAMNERRALAAGTCLPCLPTGALSPVPQFHPDRRAHLVRGRDPDHLLTGVCQGARHNRSGLGRERGDVLLSGTGLRRPDQRLLSQILRSRKKVVFLYMLLTIAGIVCLLPAGEQQPGLLLRCLPCLGFAVGYWAIFVTVAAEQFGTNLRATVATNRAQLRARHGGADHAFIPVLPPLLQHRDKRTRCRRDLPGCGFCGARLPGRNVP